eukprot:gene10909-3614_t
MVSVYTVSAVVVFLVTYFAPCFLKPTNFLNKILRYPGILIRFVILFFSIMAVMGFTLFLLVTGLRTPKQRYWSNGFVALFLNALGNFCFGVYLDIDGVEKFKKGEKSLIICNHQSLFDIFLITAALHSIDSPIVTVGKSSLKYIPFLGQYWEYAGNLFIDRDNREKAIDQLNRTKKLVEDNGLTIWIFPEGHRNEKPKLLEFKKGAFHMAYDMQLPVKPLVVETFYDKVMECNFPWNKQPIKMRVLDNVPIDNKLCQKH